MPADHPLYPPEAYHPGWWLIVAVSLLGIAVIGWWLRRTLRGLRPAVVGPDDLAGLKQEALARLNQVLADHEAGDATAAEAQQRLSGIVRRFAGIAGQGDADYRATPQLRRAAVADPRLQPVAEFVGWIEPAAFGGSSLPSVPDAVTRAREVVDEWA